MASSGSPSADGFEAEAQDLLDAIAKARKRVEGITGLVDGSLDRFRDRVDRLIRESEVDNWRQVRIFLRDVDAIAADLGKAAKEKRLSQRLVAPLDASLRKARKRAFYGPRRAWRDPDPLLRLLNNASPQGEAFRNRSFYGLLELPGYSDAKLTHVFGDARLVRGALDAAWSWLKAIRDDERRTLQIQWSEDVLV